MLTLNTSRLGPPILSDVPFQSIVLFLVNSFVRQKLLIGW